MDLTKKEERSLWNSVMNISSEFKHRRINNVNKFSSCSCMTHPGPKGGCSCHQSIPEETHSSVSALCAGPASEGRAPACSCALGLSSQGGSSLAPSGTHLRRPGRQQTLRYKPDMVENFTTVSQISAKMSQAFYIGWLKTKRKPGIIFGLRDGMGDSASSESSASARKDK